MHLHRNNMQPLSLFIFYCGWREKRKGPEKSGGDENQCVSSTHPWKQKSKQLGFLFLWRGCFLPCYISWFLQFSLKNSMDSQLHKTLQPESNSEFNYVVQHRLILYKHNPISQFWNTVSFYLPIRKSVVWPYKETNLFSIIPNYLLLNLTDFSLKFTIEAIILWSKRQTM